MLSAVIMKTQQNITIKIADVGAISMSINPETEELVRRAEHSINKVWNAWRNDFPTRNSREILAMVTYQYAKSYYQLLEQVERQQNLLRDFENEMDSLLLIGQHDRPQATDDNH